MEDENLVEQIAPEKRKPGRPIGAKNALKPLKKITFVGIKLSELNHYFKPHVIVPVDIRFLDFLKYPLVSLKDRVERYNKNQLKILENAESQADSVTFPPEIKT